MSISLVPDVPDKLVIGSVENVMKGNRKFYHTQAGTKMTPVQANYINDVLTKLIHQLLQLLPGQGLQVCRSIDGTQ
jgi:hypothetical protein